MRYVETVLSWVWRLLYLNALWLLFSLPLVTVFPSKFALFKLSDQVLTTKGEEPSFKDYQQMFRDNFLRSYLFALPVLLFFTIIWLDINFLFIQNNLLSQVWFYMIVVLALIGFTVMHFSFYLMVSQNMQSRDAWTLGFILTVRYPIHSLAVLVLYVVVGLLLLLQTGLGLLFGGSLVSCCVSLIAEQAFCQFEQQVLEQSS